MSTVLTSTLADPEGRLFEAIKNNGKVISDIYETQAEIVVSIQTSIKTVDVLKDLGFNVFIEPSGNIGNVYRQALKLALNHTCHNIHLIDFDRILHWIKNFSKELESIVNHSIPDFVLFTRTDKAFNTHPYSQRSTENIVNRIASQKIGKAVDIMSGAYGMSMTVAKSILSQSKRNDSGIYAEFIKLALINNFPISCYEVNGLDWETPDRYLKEIEKEGYEKWLLKWQSITEWSRRLEVVKNSLEIFLESDLHNSLPGE